MRNSSAKLKPTSKKCRDIAPVKRNHNPRIRPSIVKELEWSTACPDWEKRIVARKSLIASPILFPDEAAAALDVFNSFQIVDVPGSPPLGDISLPWLVDFVSSIFGAYDASTGRRLITEFFLLIAKKNTKSTSAAAVMLTALVRNWRLSAEYLILAPTIEVANNSFYPARDMIRANDELMDMFHVQEHLRTITHRETKATLKIVAAENEAVSGKKATGVLIDEFWLFGKRPHAESMLREATGGLASRPEGFIIYLSTQSDEPPAGVFKKKLDYARGVRDGRIKDKRFLPVLYEFPAKMLKAEQHKDPKFFYITNPNLGKSVDEEFLRREYLKAQEDGEESIRGFLAKHLNVEIGLGLKVSNWSGALFWEQQGDPTLTLDELIKRSEVITIGIDGGGLEDLLGLCVLGRGEDGTWLHWAYAWAHPIVLERRKQEATKLKSIAEKGQMTIVESVGEDLVQLAEIVKKVEDSGLLDRVGVDQAGIGAIVDILTDEDGPKIAFERIIGIPQGWKMVGAIKTTERKLAEGAFIHGASALMNYSVANAKIEPKGNAIVITKQVSGASKIDPLMATFDAVALMSMNPSPKKKQYQFYAIG